MLYHIYHKISCMMPIWSINMYYKVVVSKSKHVEGDLSLFSYASLGCSELLIQVYTLLAINSGDIGG